MLVSTLAVLATLLPALASTHRPPPVLRHRRLAESANHNARGLTAQPAERANLGHADAHRAIKKAIRKRDGQTCRPKPSSASASASPAASSTAEPAASPEPASASPSPASASIDNQQAWAQQASASPSPSASSNNNNSGGGGVSVSVNVGGLLQLNSNQCGWCDSNDNQPNGSEAWLNCGIDGSGWNPPYVSCQELIAADLDASGVFSPCAQYIDKFNTYGAQFNVHPIMLASFAMQESTCNAGATGANGEAGLMQITPANCESGNNCWDPDYNIRRGAQLFSQMVASNGGSCLAAIGNYNGWSAGMTTSTVYSAAVCSQQQNLDYLFQFTNGWMQNKNAYSMGQYFNLASC